MSRCTASPWWVSGWVWTVIGAPVVGLGDCAHDAFDPGREARLVDSALQQPRSHASSRDALHNVADEEVDHRVGHLHAERLVEGRSPVVEVEGDVLVRVAARRHDDVEVGNPGGDLLYAREVAAESHHGRVDDGSHARVGQCGELGDGVVDAVDLVAPLGGIVLLDVRGQHEDVLVDVGAPERRAVNRSIDGVNRGHGVHPRRRATWALEGG
jgi:hypothetical protein